MKEGQEDTALIEAEAGQKIRRVEEELIQVVHGFDLHKVPALVRKLVSELKLV